MPNVKKKKNKNEKLLIVVRVARVYHRFHTSRNAVYLSRGGPGEGGQQNGTGCTPTPAECQRAPIPQCPAPNPSSTRDSQPPPWALRSLKPPPQNTTLKLEAVQVPPLTPPTLFAALPCQSPLTPTAHPLLPPTLTQFVLIYLLRDIFEVEAYFYYLLELNPSHSLLICSPGI